MQTHRRDLFRSLAALGIGTLPFQRALASEAERIEDPPKAEPPTKITAEMVDKAEWIAGLTLTETERTAVAAELTRKLTPLAAARKIVIPNSVAPAFQFNPAPGMPPSTVGRGTVVAPKLDIKKPESEDDLAFLGVTELAELMKSKKVTSVELTKLSLKRLKQYDPALKCVVTLPEESALKIGRASGRERV